MRESRRALISDLVGDLTPVRRPGKTGRALALWLGVSGAYSAAMVLMTGPLRAGAAAALWSAPLYALEVAVAAAAIGLLAWAALRTAIPAEPQWDRSLGAPLAALAAWVLLLVVGLATEPALETAMLGKRDHCFWQTVIFGVPSSALLLFAARGLLPLWPRATGALAGAAAAAWPALLMQLGCMYEPGHALGYHLSAIPLLAALGALVGPRVLARRAVVPRRRSAAIH